MSIVSYNKITNDNNYTLGNFILKDLYNGNYTYGFNPNSYSQLFPNMAPLIDSNIEAGEKNAGDRLNADYWGDWGDDVFDNWGFFYLYDVNSGKYCFPYLTDRNNGYGVLNTQVFSAFGRTFTIQHGYPVYGIFKFDISVNDNLPFRFGAYGNMGSDGSTGYNEYVQPFGSINLYYTKNYQYGWPVETFYSYCIPRRVSDNASKTYEIYYAGDHMSIMSKEVTQGVLFYFSKTNDVKDWVLDDLVPTMVCFKEGSQILTDRGYVPVEHLQKGDLVQTYGGHGLVPIYGIGSKEVMHKASFDNRIKDQLYVCNPADFPEMEGHDPLVITGCHSLLVNRFDSDDQRQRAIDVNGKVFVTDKKYRLPACVHAKTEVYPKAGKYTIYHFALENDEPTKNYGVYANGLLVETCSKRFLSTYSGLTLK